MDNHYREPVVFGSSAKLCISWVHNIMVLTVITETGQKLPPAAFARQPQSLIDNAEYVLGGRSGRRRPYKEKSFSGEVFYDREFNPPFEITFSYQDDQTVTLELSLADARLLIWQLQQAPRLQIAPLKYLEERQRAIERCEEAALMVVRFTDEALRSLANLVLVYVYAALERLEEGLAQEQSNQTAQIPAAEVIQIG